ncbi:MAG TPA: YidC/Oxa1 family membrane protein insertase [Candidatus Dormibacteraeota bacterium]
MPVLSLVGPYGVAIIVMTILIKTVLSPLFHFQLSLSRKTMQEQRKVAPEVAALRKKFKGDPQKQNEAVMALYREHGINPLSGLAGCIPTLLQLPILTALYYVFLGNARQHTYEHDYFLWVPHLNDTPSLHPLIPGLPIPVLPYLVIPLLAAATTFVQSRMMQQPLSPTASEQEQQQAQMTQSMQVLMPLMIAYFAIVTPAGLGLYWFISNCFAIIQQYFVTGWGGLRPQPDVPPPTARAVPSNKPRPDGGGTPRPAPGGPNRPARAKRARR